MDDMKPRICSLLEGLYPAQVIDDVAAIGTHYLTNKLDRPAYVDVPPNLHKFTEVRQMSDTKVAAPADFHSEVLSDLGILGDDGTIKGAFNHIITRMISIPMMLGGYIENWPSAKEISLYKDPPLLQRDREYVTRAHEKYFAQAEEKLKSMQELALRFKMLGEIGEEAARIEPVYPATSSTEAYENFGIWHLFPGNKQVDLTATSPGIILPTEANPLAFKDSVDILKKNLLRTTYFKMLQLCVSSPFGHDRVRRYFASRDGTIENLQKYPMLLDAAKEILAEYLAIGTEIFPIRIGRHLPQMKYATLIGDKGVVYSVRDEEQKGKIARNLTVYDKAETRRWREVFDDQWRDADDLDRLDMLDELFKKRIHKQ